ncbi:hypothetical protein AC249_AIPGENE20193 [Exaiptasia diaphana]|nr:hypothetical protein AC249_AIPGENE20193 [Exaiptasia diaphana]
MIDMLDSCNYFIKEERSSHCEFKEVLIIQHLLELQKKKWKISKNNLYDEVETYHLLYEDTSRALFLPRCKKESFSLQRYKEEIDKDFKRITIFLSTHSDLQSSEGDAEQDADKETAGNDEDEKPSKCVKIDYDSDDGHFLINDDPLGKYSTLSTSSTSQESTSTTKPDATESNSKASSSASVTTCIDLTLPPPTMQMDLDAQLASHLQAMYDQQQDYSCDPNTCISSTGKDKPLDVTELDNECSVVKALAVKIEKPGQLFIVVRRGSRLLWRRINSVAMALEFFTLYLPDMGSAMFPGGSPVDSILNVQNSSFLTCGQIVVSSLSQGRPPRFLDESVFNLMVNLDLRPNEIDESKHLTESDKASLKFVQDNLTSNTDMIIENGYTGVIDEEHNPESCKNLFVKSSQSKEVDANFVFSILRPIYSQEGSSRKKVEESVMDFFQDSLFMLGDETNIPGYTEAIACNDGSESKAEDLNADQQSEQFQSPDLSLSGILGWLTGQKHVPIGEELFKVSVHFNHDCMINNPKHRICFPIVGACAREITLPMAHLKTTDEFKEVFLVAICKGQSFGKA